MAKHISPRGRSFQEQRLAACEAKLKVCSLQTAAILNNFCSILSNRVAVTEGYFSLPAAQQLHLTSAISAGTFRHEKLCCMVVTQLETSSHRLAAIFEEYLRAHYRLRKRFPSLEETTEYTWVMQIPIYLDQKLIFFVTISNIFMLLRFQSVLTPKYKFC